MTTQERYTQITARLEKILDKAVNEAPIDVRINGNNAAQVVGGLTHIACQFDDDVEGVAKIALHDFRCDEEMRRHLIQLAEERLRSRCHRIVDSVSDFIVQAVAQYPNDPAKQAELVGKFEVDAVKMA